MKVMVVSAHPDDEVLGCGGTLLKHKNAGDEIGWLITTNMFESPMFPSEVIATRQEEIACVACRLGIKEVYKLDYPTMGLSDVTLTEMIPKIGEIFSGFKPEVIYVVNRSDAHSDHLVTFRAVMACTKPFRFPHVKRVLMYECLSETEQGVALPENIFVPNYFVDISGHMEGKLDLMKIYGSELGEHPFPRSLENIRALAHYRGASVGVRYAEAFQLLKYIDK